LLSVRNLAKTYGHLRKRQALRDVSFEVMPDDADERAGENGAGKSTLLKILARELRPDGGHVPLAGALGLLLGMLISSELAGFFLIIMVSLMDTVLQAPVENPLASKDFLAAFPSSGPMQVAVSGGFGHGIPAGSVALSLVWFAGIALVGLLIFWRRTRAWNPQAHSRARTGALASATTG
jgi:energy-coupling factor transporter ATP-binding protein EcfA2